MRIAFLLFKIILLSITYLLLKKHIDKSILVIFLAATLPLNPLSMAMFSYNTIPLSLLLPISASLFCALFENNRKKVILFSIVGGIFAAIVALAYPTMIILPFYFGVIFGILLLFLRHSLLGYYFYYLSGAVVAAIVTGSFLILSGGVDRLIFGIKTILEGDYFKIYQDSKIHIIAEAFLAMARHFAIIFICAFCLFCFIQICYAILKRKKLGKHRTKTFLVCFVSSQLIYTVFIAIQSRDNYYMMQERLCIAGCFCAIIYLFFLKKSRTKMLCLTVFLWVPGVISLAVVSISSYSGISDRWYLVFVPSLCSFLFCYYAIAENFKGTVKNYFLSIPISFVILYALICCNNYLTIVYRDNGIQELTHRVQGGIYKGIFTTKEKATDIFLLETGLKKYVSRDDDILFMDVAPFGYLMVDGRPCAPTSWDAMSYSYGFNNDEIMYKYFETVDKTPDKIVYVDFGRDKILSIEKAGYNFNNFVLKNYRYVGTENCGIYRFKVYERIFS